MCDVGDGSFLDRLELYAVSIETCATSHVDWRQEMGESGVTGRQDRQTGKGQPPDGIQAHNQRPHMRPCTPGRACHHCGVSVFQAPAPAVCGDPGI